MNNDTNRVVGTICSSYDWIESYSDGALRTVLSHNDEPTTLQVTSVASCNGVIALANDRITQDINSLENALVFLRARRQAIIRISSQHVGALSKFRWLPNEILSKIFLHACGDERFRVGCLDEGPWKLRAVCRKWARIVEGCSQLWCNMVIYVAEDQLRPATFAQALRFSGSRPLHMKLSMEDLDYDYLRRIRWKKFCKVVDTITPSSPRWETLIIKSPEDLIRVVLEWFPRLERRLSLLHSLKLQGAECEALQMSPPTRSALLTAPLLETVQMHLSDPEHIAQLLDILPIPCQQIRQLLCHSSQYQPSALYRRLSLSKETFPFLERCVFISLDASTQSSNPISDSSRVENDGVLHLVTSQENVLDTFSFPSLRTLSIGDPENPGFRCDTDGTIFKHASDMLLASGCSLVSLALSHTFTLVDEFLHILEIVPTLEILDMRVAWSEGAARDKVLCKFFTALGNRTHISTFSLLPALQDLRLSIKAPGNDYPATDRHDFRFVSRVFEAITERSKSPSDFRAFPSRCRRPTRQVGVCLMVTSIGCRTSS
ncbi:hypothetical protein BDZ89DRAFT_569396 [Hymenopellis radicata]|nr:hypothetical protein BDZ89DRAFT_569396 [Hymenopellis radicata]